MKKALLIYIALGVLVFANSKFQDWTFGYGLFNILDISRIHGGLENWYEVLFIMPIILFVMLNMQEYNTSKLKKQIFYLFILLIISNISLILLTDKLGAGIRTILRYTYPIICFVIFSSLKFKETDIKYFLKILAILFYVIIGIGFYQWLVLGFTIDHLHSLVDNAHIFGFLMFYGVTYYITKYFVYKRVKYLLLSIPPLILALVASNDKATILFIPVLTFAYIVYNKIKIKTLIRVSLVSLVSIITAIFIFTRLSDDLRQNLAGGLNRLIIGLEYLPITEIIENTAQYKSYTSIPDIYFSNIYPILIGVGPTNFGSAEVNEKSEFSELTFAQEDYYLLETDIFRFGSSDVLVLLIEFGFIFSIIYFLILKNMFQLSLNFLKIEDNLFIKHLLLWIFCYLLIVTTISFISFREGLSYFTNTIPYFILLGMINSNIINTYTDQPQKVF